MPYTIIKGTFHVNGYSPDGDTIRFKADNPVHWLRLKGPSPKVNRREHASLRLEAIDALETHFNGTTQPYDLANGATDRLLSLMGITNVQWGGNVDGRRKNITSADNDEVPGYILSREVERYRRPIAFAFVGEPKNGEVDGSDIRLEADRVKESVNWKLTNEGWVYVTFYEGLFPDLRKAFIDAVVNARQQSVGLWASKRELTNVGIKVRSLNEFQEEAVIMPKLFRRIVKWYKEGREDGVDFKDFIKNKDPVLDLRSAGFTHFDTYVSVEGDTIRLNIMPESLVFRP